jgi:F-type H+-transporting ATPase subunit b
MNELMTKLGIDGRLLLAQLINFVVLIAVLYRFAYKPILTLLEKRRVRIEKSLAEAQRIDEESRRMEQLKKQKVDEAKREAAAVLEDAAKKAEAVKQETLVKTRTESEKIVMKAKEQIAHERGELLKGVQSEAAELVAGAVEKVLKEKMDGEKDKKFIHDALHQLAH